MRIHANAALALKRRERLTRRVLEDGWSITSDSRQVGRLPVRCPGRGRPVPEPVRVSRIPVATEGRRGQILVGAAMPGLIRRKVYDFGYRATVTDHEDGVKVATVLEATRRGNVLIGASRELRETSVEPDPAMNALLAERALELAPGLAAVRILRSYAGVRPTLPSGMPVIGPVGGVEGLWLATGHEGAGIGLAPGTAEMICALVTGGETPVAADSFSPSRLLTDSSGVFEGVGWP